MNGMFAGVAHAFAPIRPEDVAPEDFAPLLAEWLTAMAHTVAETAGRLRGGDLTGNVVSSLATQAAGIPTCLRTAEEQRVSPELPAPYLELMARRVAQGHGDEDGAGLIGLLDRRRSA
ncbi:hypothetical protein ACFW6P_00390 [Streptomyces sp. NPDC058741]